MKTESGIYNESGFAKSVLWHLAAIQADVYQNQMLLIELLARQSGGDARSIQNQWKGDSDKLRMTRYLEALEVSGVSRDSDPKPEEKWSAPWWVDSGR